MRVSSELQVLVIIWTIFNLIFGFAFAPSLRPDFAKIEPTYLNGVLTASGILFGVWAIIIGREPQTEYKKSLYSWVGEGFLTALSLLVASVILVTLTAFNIFASSFCLLFCVANFITNAMLIYLSLKDYMFRKE